MKEINCKGLNCPMPVINTKKYFDSIVSLPLYPKMSNEDVEDVIGAVIHIINNNHKW